MGQPGYRSLGRQGNNSNFGRQGYNSNFGRQDNSSNFGRQGNNQGQQGNGSGVSALLDLANLARSLGGNQ